MNGEITLENYEEKRRELVETNSNMLGIVMREKEVLLNGYLTKMKKELSDLYGGNVPYDIPVITDEKLRNSKLYKFCSAMPKGADLHVHDMALLPAKELIKLLLGCREFYINADRHSFDLKYINPEEKAPEGYICFAESVKSGYYSVDEIIYNWTVIGAEKSGKSIWDYFEGLFDKHAVLSNNIPFMQRYYEYAFDYYCRLNICHIEIHIMLTESIDESAECLKAMREAYYITKKKYPYFTVRIIGAGVKADNDRIQTTKKCFLNSTYVQETIKDESNPDEIADFVIGFDIVNEEDSSLPLHAFAPMLIKAKKQYPNMKLYIHGGESLDAQNDNLIDAYLLGVSRVGHGLNLYRYPDLHSRYIKSEICLEICPVSNQRLGYTKDIRNHPATEYLRSGMTVSLCSDDPAYMENETLTDDFFAAVAGWNLSVADLKQLAINSIMYSGLSTVEKTQKLKYFNKAWNTFVDDFLSKSGEEV